MTTFKMIEACELKDRGSMGAHYVMQSALAAGFQQSQENYDVELISVHHCEDFTRLAELPRRGKVRIVGGHPMANNCKPAIPFADAICIGEGESWIKEAMIRLSNKCNIESLRGMGGTLITSDYPCEIPKAIWEKDVPKNKPYLNQETKGHAPTWYIEMARGCPYACHYCELGNTVPYRIQDTEWLVKQLYSLPRKSRVSLFAPDEASHPGYRECLEAIKECGHITMFGSVRADQVTRRDIRFPSNMLLRVGLDGLTEKTRFRVNKKIRDDDIVNYFRTMSERKHNNFKIFLVVGYPWETLADVKEWEALFERVRRIPRHANAHVRVKITPLIPQPSTPLAGAKAKYNFMVHNELEKWIKRVAKPVKSDGAGWFFEQDGCIMSRRKWIEQIRLTNGDENTLTGGMYEGRKTT